MVELPSGDRRAPVARPEVGDDFESPDAAELDELDLSPRTTAVSGRGRRRGVIVLSSLALVAGAAAFVVARGLGEATLYFRNVDEAVAQRSELGDRRFRMQGTVVPGSLRKTAEGVAFSVTFAGVSADVRHRGDPPQMFREGMPVVLEGAWHGDVFRSDRLMVKHSEVYVAKHPERVRGQTDPTDLDSR
ncbi:MAG: hypothetical protein KatS3mg008_0896 [Acidimicrobiales bacterium]|nr:MAG: hypothetical protein KatS3mg008_0896 [Acidimicrobiales bacterium]